MRIVLLFLALAGCIKTAAVQQAAQPAPVALTTVLESTESPGLQSIPDGVSSRLSEQVRARGLVPQSVDGATTTGNSTDTRLTWLAESASGAQVLMLIETEARFSVQVNGRYRWNVDATLTLAHADGSADPQTSTVSAPVALVYAHQDEEDALLEASPLIARRLGIMLDAWIASGQL